MIQKYVVIGGGVFAVTVLGLTLVGLSKINTMAKQFNKATSEMKDVTVKDIQDAIVESAVRDAAEDKVSGYVARARNEVMDAAKAELSTEVRAAVNEAKPEIKNQLTGEIERQVANIDIEDMKKTVRAHAEEKVLNKFEGNLQDLLDKYSGNLARIQKIYDSVAEAMGKGINGKDSGGKLTFSVGAGA